jgi:hypothetical protein
MVTLLVWASDRYCAAIACLCNLPIVLVHHPMVPMAKKHDVVEITRAAMRPMNKMMSITP